MSAPLAANSAPEMTASAIGAARDSVHLAGMSARSGMYLGSRVKASEHPVRSCAARSPGIHRRIALTYHPGAERYTYSCLLRRRRTQHL